MSNISTSMALSTEKPIVSFLNICKLHCRTTAFLSKRDASIELWRIVCMFAVVLSHVVAVNHVARFTWFNWHIPGFLLISGYFGIRFSWRKALKLLAIVYVLYWLTIPLRGFNENIVSVLLPHGGWFVPFYLVLMVLSPLMEAALENRCHHRSIMIAFMLLLCVGWIPSFSGSLHVNMMRIAGMQGNGLLLIMATYILGRMLFVYRDSALVRILRGWGFAFMIVLVMCSVAIACRFPRTSCYSSPLAIGAAMCGLAWFSGLRNKIPVKISSLIVKLSPSMFGVYIVHECCLKSWQTLPGDVGWGRVICHAIMLFAVGVGVDVLRRMCFALLSCAYRMVVIPRVNR